MLLRDAKYRGYTIQFIALCAFVAFMGWLGWNAYRNLAAAGQDFNFDFLGRRAGYAIDQTLIPYTPDDTHARAALVGILNTLLVAFLGCLAATFLGITLGVMRLSTNWLIARITAVYVEIFRNVPLLIWILISGAVLTISAPAPRAFREDGEASMALWNTVAVTNRGVYTPKPVWGEGAGMLLAVFLLSIAAIIATRIWARKRQEATGATFPVGWVSLALLILPSVAAFYMLGKPVSWDIPELGGFNFRGGLKIGTPFVALWLGLTLYTSAFIAENVRAGILSVNKGQTEAAAALGLKPGRIMNLVILPQALRVIIPPLISHYLNLTKNSSLAIAISYSDVTATLAGITLNQTGRALECILLLMAFYLTCSLIISAFGNWYNRRAQIKER
ncbi:amino acid ABC transporter permease [Paracoccaceae bacterium GXU_MW_L88]